jgi:hypothetical protein
MQRIIFEEDIKSSSQRLEFLEDITEGESMIDKGGGIPHNKALEMALKRVFE